METVKSNENTQLQTQGQNQLPGTAKELFSTPNIRKRFEEILGKRAAAFMTSVLQVVAGNEKLQKADPQSIYHAAAVAATLELPVNQNLGFAYIIPYEISYKDEGGNWQKRLVAQFQLGYKGFIQLAQRSGKFQSLEAKPVYDGQVVDDDSFLGYHFNWKAKKSDTVIGYAAYFKLLNGFEKYLLMDLVDLQKHGAKYSKTFSSKDQKIRDKSLWTTDFDAMATKTVIKLLLSRFAPLSIEMERAIETDQAVISPEGNQYIDNEPLDQSWFDMLKECKTIDDVEAKQKENAEQIAGDIRLEKLFQERKDQIKKPSAKELADRASDKTEKMLTGAK